MDKGIGIIGPTVNSLYNKLHNACYLPLRVIDYKLLICLVFFIIFVFSGQTEYLQLWFIYSNAIKKLSIICAHLRFLQISGCTLLPEVLWSLRAEAMSFTHTFSWHFLGHGRHSVKYFLVVVLFLFSQFLSPKNLLLKLVFNEVSVKMS